MIPMVVNICTMHTNVITNAATGYDIGVNGTKAYNQWYILGYRKQVIYITLYSDRYIFSILLQKFIMVQNVI